MMFRMLNSPGRIGAVAVLLLLAAGCESFKPAGDRECPVHELSLSRELVVVRPGFPRGEYEKQHAEEFPYSGTIFSGGLPPGAPQEISSRLVCPACRRAEAGWLKQHRW